jgi:hypothetical protein
MTVDCTFFDSHVVLTSIMVSTLAAMADIKFHSDVIFLFSPHRCRRRRCCGDDETCFGGKSVQHQGRV